MIGLTEFSSTRTASLIHYINNFGTESGVYGVRMPASTPRNTSRVPISRFCFTLFYLKTWVCPVGLFFDPSINMCTSCPIINCIVCYNLTVCSTCDVAHGYFLNSTSGQCQPCGVIGCTNCTDLLVCNTCSQSLNYIIQPDQSCLLCDINANSFANTTSGSCETCTIPNCINCSTLSTCYQCSTSYYVNGNSTCSFCNSNLNFYIDPGTGDCDVCTIPNCINCSSLTTCR